MNKLPKRISPNLLIEAVAEIRFDSGMPEDAVFGMVYSKLRENFPKVEELPILQIPKELRSVGAVNFESQATHKLVGRDSFVHIGPRVAAVITNQYSGWTEFAPGIEVVFSQVIDSLGITSLNRAALRYVNAMKDRNLFEVSNLTLSLNQKDLTFAPTVLRVELPRGEFTTTVQVVNRAAWQAGGSQATGSAFDIDTFTTGSGKGIASDSASLQKTFFEIHQISKETFFETLKEDFVASLAPVYD